MVMKTHIIGDIHGCRRPFEELLGILDPDPSRDRLILLGDLFDRGPDSWGVLQIVKKLSTLSCITKGTVSAAFTRG